VPVETLIQNVKFTEIASKGEQGDKISSFQFNIKNDTTRQLFWEVRFMFHGKVFLTSPQTGNWSVIGGNYYQYIYMLPEQDAVLLNEASPLTVFSNNKMKQDNYQIKFYFSDMNVQYTKGGEYYIELRNVSESYYKYQKQLYLYKTGGSSELGSSAQTYPLYSNITNGYGIFTSYAVSYYMVKFK
jgi:hypothetical protein